MSSLKSRMFLSVLRHSHWLRFRLKPEPIHDSVESVLKFREKVSKTPSMFGKLPDTMEVLPVNIGDVYAEWMQPVGYDQQKTILYFHGGGYVSGNCEAHHPHVAKVVTGSGIRALLFEYRLAPEHPFPGAIDDAVAAYQYLLDQNVPAEQIVFMGDSAGGGLCLATLVALKDKGITLPAAAVALSPWTDLACTGESYRTNAKTCLSPEGSWTVFSKYYVADSDPTHPWISPLYGDLTGLPPLSIYVGSDEILRDDSVRFAEKAQSAGVDVSLTIGEGLFHCYPICAPIFPEATEAMAEIYAFMHLHLQNQRVAV